VPGDQAGLGFTSDPQVQIESLGDQVDRPRKQFKVDPERGMAEGQLGKGRGQALAAEPRAGADAQQAPGRRLRRADGLGHLLGVLQDPLGPAEHRLAVLAQAHPARGAMQQPHLQHLLQQGDPLAHVGGRDAQLLGGGEEAPVAGHGAEQAEIFEGGQIVHESCPMFPHIN
jgi:hypothetical protein